MLPEVKQPKFNILFSGDTQVDVLNLCEYIDDYAHQVGMREIGISVPAINALFGALAQDFPYPLGSGNASPFKKVAAFTANFVVEKPIQQPFPVQVFGDLAGRQNALVAYALSVDALHGAELEKDDGKVVLTERIKVSAHQWADIIMAIDDCTPQKHSFKMLSLLYESLVYRWNPDASYAPLY
jgi:hypothetical protein